MAKAGRPALPANVHLIRGNPSKLSDEELGARNTIPVAVPPCPRDLSAGARKRWHYLARKMVAAGIITELDRDMFAMLCSASNDWARLQRACDEIVRAKGVDGLIDITPSGYKQMSALTQLRDRAEARLVRLCREFGLSPSSRVSATSGQQLSLPSMPDDPMEAFLTAGDAVVRSAG